MNYTDHSNLSTKVLIESLKRPSVSMLAPLFTASLIQSDARLTKPEFTAVARQFICLPPVSNGEATRMVEDKCGCSVQVCNSRKCQAPNDVLDAAGNHGLMCNPGVKAKRATSLREHWRVVIVVQVAILVDNLPLSHFWEKYFQEMMWHVYSQDRSV